MGYSEPTSTFISRKSIGLCISGKLNDEIISGFFTFLERSFSDIDCLPTQWYLDCERKRCSGVVKLAFFKEDVMSKPLCIPVNENENYWILVIVFPKAKLVVSYDPLKIVFKSKASEIVLTFLTSYCERRNQNMNFQTWKFGILDGRKQLNTTDCGVFVLGMAVEIAAKEIIFDSLPNIDLRYWIPSQCLSDNFPRSIMKRIKKQVERITMAPRFRIDISLHVYNFQDLFRITRRKENKTFGDEDLDGKNGKKIYCCFLL